MWAWGVLPASLCLHQHIKHLLLQVNLCKGWVAPQRWDQRPSRLLVRVLLRRVMLPRQQEQGGPHRAPVRPLPLHNHSSSLSSSHPHRQGRGSLREAIKARGRW